MKERAAVDATDADVWTALKLAAQDAHLDVVRYLVGEGGAAVDAANADGWTALMMAVDEKELVLTLRWRNLF